MRFHRSRVTLFLAVVVVVMGGSASPAASRPSGLLYRPLLSSSRGMKGLGIRGGAGPVLRNPEIFGIALPSRLLLRAAHVWLRPIKFYGSLTLLAALLTLLEWRWRLAREEKLRRLVRERTRQLELEKIDLLRAKAALARLASRDALTGIYNRLAILDVLEEEIQRSCRTQAPLLVVLADLDHFKRVNDAYGHLAGDEVVREFARRIAKHLGPGEAVGRYGGEEFLIVLPGAGGESIGRIEALRRQIAEEPFALPEARLRVTASFGAAVTHAPARGQDCFKGCASHVFAEPSRWATSNFGCVPGKFDCCGAANAVELLLSRADRALYRAKARGRNQVAATDFADVRHTG